MFSPDGYRTLRETAGAVRRTDRGVLSVGGADRATWLQGLVTSDVLALAPGRRCYAAYLTPQGRMITDMHVVALADRLLLDVPAALAAPLAARLDELIFAEDTQVIDESSSLDVWGVYGPAAERAVRQATAAPLDDAGYGVPGFALYLERGLALPAGVAELPQVDLVTLDVLRIEAGTPKFFADMDEHTIPLEAGIEDRAISFTKGCYVGQEVIVRVMQRGGGRVARKLVRLAIAAPAIEPGARLVSGDREVGRVTSAAFSPALGAVAALGYVHRGFTDSGTCLTVVADDARHDAVVQ
jgi:folate-binding protein YgfZ